jgi:hypothetical protein
MFILNLLASEISLPVSGDFVFLLRRNIDA